MRRGEGACARDVGVVRREDSSRINPARTARRRAESLQLAGLLIRASESTGTRLAPEAAGDLWASDARRDRQRRDQRRGRWRELRIAANSSQSRRCRGCVEPIHVPRPRIAPKRGVRFYPRPAVPAVREQPLRRHALRGFAAAAASKIDHPRAAADWTGASARRGFRPHPRRRHRTRRLPVNSCTNNRDGRGNHDSR